MNVNYCFNIYFQTKSVQVSPKMVDGSTQTDEVDAKTRTADLFTATFWPSFLRFDMKNYALRIKNEIATDRYKLGVFPPFLHHSSIKIPCRSI